MIEGVICNPAASASPQSQILKDVCEKRRLEKRKHCDSASKCSKRQRLCASAESLATDNDLSPKCKFTCQMFPCLYHVDDVMNCMFLYVRYRNFFQVLAA